MIRQRNSARAAGIDVAVLWERYAATPTVAVRNQLVEAYLPLVRTAASIVCRRLPATAPDWHDLVSEGVCGLLQAIDGFEPDRGIKFESYAAPRIYGSIRDGVRRDDRLSRRRRQQETERLQRRDELAQLLGRTPTDDEVDESFGGRHVAAPPMLRSLHDEVNEDVELLQLLAGNAPPPEQRLQDLEGFRFLLRGLSKTERLILLLYYQEDMTMAQVAAQIGIGESRVSQLHKAILARIRDRLATGGRTHERVDPRRVGKPGRVSVVSRVVGGVQMKKADVLEALQQFDADMADMGHGPRRRHALLTALGKRLQLTKSQISRLVGNLRDSTRNVES